MSNKTTDLKDLIEHFNQEDSRGGEEEIDMDTAETQIDPSSLSSKKSKVQFNDSEAEEETDTAAASAAKKQPGKEKNKEEEAEDDDDEEDGEEEEEEEEDPAPKKNDKGKEQQEEEEAQGEESGDEADDNSGDLHKKVKAMETEYNDKFEKVGAHSLKMKERLKVIEERITKIDEQNDVMAEAFEKARAERSGILAEVNMQGFTTPDQVKAIIIEALTPASEKIKAMKSEIEKLTKQVQQTASTTTTTNGPISLGKLAAKENGASEKKEKEKENKESEKKDSQQQQQKVVLSTNDIADSVLAQFIKKTFLPDTKNGKPAKVAMNKTDVAEKWTEIVTTFHGMFENFIKEKGLNIELTFTPDEEDEEEEEKQSTPVQTTKKRSVEEVDTPASKPAAKASKNVVPAKTISTKGK